MLTRIQINLMKRDYVQIMIGFYLILLTNRLVLSSTDLCVQTSPPYALDDGNQINPMTSNDMTNNQLSSGSISDQDRYILMRVKDYMKKNGLTIATPSPTTIPTFDQLMSAWMQQQKQQKQQQQQQQQQQRILDGRQPINLNNRPLIGRGNGGGVIDGNNIGNRDGTTMRQTNAGEAKANTVVVDMVPDSIPSSSSSQRLDTILQASMTKSPSSFNQVKVNNPRVMHPIGQMIAEAPVKAEIYDIEECDLEDEQEDEDCDEEDEEEDCQDDTLPPVAMKKNSGKERKGKDGKSGKQSLMLKEEMMGGKERKKEAAEDMGDCLEELDDEMKMKEDKISSKSDRIDGINRRKNQQMSNGRHPSIGLGDKEEETNDMMKKEGKGKGVEVGSVNKMKEKGNDASSSSPSTTSPSSSSTPTPSSTTSPSKSPSPTTSPSKSPSPTTSPSKSPSPTTSPSMSPSPTTSPSKSPSPTTMSYLLPLSSPSPTTPSLVLQTGTFKPRNTSSSSSSSHITPSINTSLMTSPSLSTSLLTNSTASIGPVKTSPTTSTTSTSTPLTGSTSTSSPQLSINQSMNNEEEEEQQQDKIQTPSTSSLSSITTGNATTKQRPTDQQILSTNASDQQPINNTMAMRKTSTTPNSNHSSKSITEQKGPMNNRTTDLLGKKGGGDILTKWSPVKSINESMKGNVTAQNVTRPHSTIIMANDLVKQLLGKEFGMSKQTTTKPMMKSPSLNDTNQAMKSNGSVSPTSMIPQSSLSSINQTETGWMTTQVANVNQTIPSSTQLNNGTDQQIISSSLRKESKPNDSINKIKKKNEEEENADWDDIELGTEGNKTKKESMMIKGKMNETGNVVEKLLGNGMMKSTTPLTNATSDRSMKTTDTNNQTTRNQSGKNEKEDNKEKTKEMRKNYNDRPKVNNDDVNQQSVIGDIKSSSSSNPNKTIDNDEMTSSSLSSSSLGSTVNQDERGSNITATTDQEGLIKNDTESSDQTISEYISQTWKKIWSSPSPSNKTNNNSNGGGGNITSSSSISSIPNNNDHELNWLLNTTDSLKKSKSNDQTNEMRNNGKLSLGKEKLSKTNGSLSSVINEEEEECSDSEQMIDSLIDSLSSSGSDQMTSDSGQETNDQIGKKDRSINSIQNDDDSCDEDQISGPDEDNDSNNQESSLPSSSSTPSIDINQTDRVEQIE